MTDAPVTIPRPRIAGLNAGRERITVGEIERDLQGFSQFGDPADLPDTAEIGYVIIPAAISDLLSDKIDFMDTLTTIFTQVQESAIDQMPKEIGSQAEFIEFLGEAKLAVIEKFGADVHTEFELDDVNSEEGDPVFRFVIHASEAFESALVKLQQLDEWLGYQTSASSDLCYFDLKV